MSTLDSVFYFKRHDTELNRDIYRVDVKELSENECHLFFPVIHSEELIISTALEYMLFNPENKTMNAKFNIHPVHCGDIKLFWCRFPKEFKFVCERIGKLYGMTMHSDGRIIAEGGSGEDLRILEIPRKENIVYFKGARSFDLKKIQQECEDVTWLGNSCHKLGID